MTDNTVLLDYDHAAPTHSNTYLFQPITKIVRDAQAKGQLQGLEAFDLGCGNGATADMLHGLGFNVTGVDPSDTGIDVARESYPNCTFAKGSAYDDLAKEFGTFPLVVSSEVVEHLYDPPRYASTLYDLVAPDGMAIVTTPYHGYLKNVALAVSGELDHHFRVHTVGGHIKFFSIKTLRKLLSEAGFKQIEFRRVGRIPVFAKSMIAIARK